MCVGFGVATPAQAHAMAQIADGVIVGSAIVKEININAKAKDLPQRMQRFVAGLVRAVQR